MKVPSHISDKMKAMVEGMMVVGQVEVDSMRTSIMEDHYCIRKAVVEHSLLEVLRDMSGLLSREDGWLEVARQWAVQPLKSVLIIRNGYDFLFDEMY